MTTTSDTAVVPSSWFEQKEQSAGALRLRILLWIRRLLGQHALKGVLWIVVLFIWPFARPARAALREYYGVLGFSVSGLRFHLRTYRHLVRFAFGLADKLDVCCGGKGPEIVPVRDADWTRFETHLAHREGVFLMASHEGTIEVLPAARRLAAANPKVHAFQQLDHDSVFTRLFLRRLDPRQMELHDVASVGVETAAVLQEAMARGELVLMAADRVAAANPKAVLHRAFLGRDCVWPKGVFAFARVTEAPVFFVTCIRTGWSRYEVRVRAATDPRDRARTCAEYVAFLERQVRRHPLEWFNFYRFFPRPAEDSASGAERVSHATTSTHAKGE